MSMFFSSDFHFNHNKDFIYAARGFSSIEQHNEEIIRRWNEKVQPRDKAFILGDISLGQDDAKSAELISRLNGEKVLLVGNHDTNARIAYYRNHHLFANILLGERFKHRKRTLILSHYPTIVSNYERTDTINIHGHTHQKEKFYDNKWYMYNCGVDAHDCYPVELDEMMDEIFKFKGENIKNEDLH